jgi:hypothetical protein
MNNSLEIDKPVESPSLSNVNDIDVLRRQMKEQHTRPEACIFFVCSIPFDCIIYLFAERVGSNAEEIE